MSDAPRRPPGLDGESRPLRSAGDRGPAAAKRDASAPHLPPGGISFAAGIADPALLDAQLDKLAARARGHRIGTLLHDGVRFAQIMAERDRIVTLLSRALHDASYTPLPARMAEAFIGGKPRAIGRVGALDLVVHGAVADVLARRAERILRPEVFGYRRGRSPLQAIRWLSHVARRHRRALADVRQRGLYVLRSDVTSFTDTIPVDDDAPLWGTLLGLAELDARAPHAAMLKRLLRPAIDGADGPRLRGLLFGVPTTNVVGNVYLTPLDDALAAIDGAHYARYGDDVLFAHHDPHVVLAGRAVLVRVLGALGLSANPKKLAVFYWNGAGRKSTLCPEAAPAERLPFLGAAVRFDGTVVLPPKKWRALLAALRRRLTRTAAALPKALDVERRARVLAAVANDILSPRSELALPYAPLLLTQVSDRAQLRELDHLVALWIAELSTGRLGPRAFRAAPPRWLREKAGLVSRVAARNDASACALPRIG